MNDHEEIIAGINYTVQGAPIPNAVNFAIADLLSVLSTAQPAWKLSNPGHCELRIAVSTDKNGMVDVTGIVIT